MDVRTEMGLDVKPARRRGPGGRVVLTILAATALMMVLSSAIVYVVRGESSNAFDPVETARLAPADSHLFLAFNTDLTSEPWLAVPRLLDALGVEDQVREDLRESAVEEGFDYDADFVPVVTSIRRIGLVAQYVGADDGDVVGFIDTRDPGELVALMQTGSGEGEWSQQRDEALGLDFDVFTPAAAGLDSELALTSHEDVVYVSDDPAAIVRFLQRQAEQPSLGDVEAFSAAIEEVSDDALLVGYGSGAVFAHSDFQDFLDGLEDTSDVDMTASTLAFAFTAEASGWGGRVAVGLDSGFGAFGDAVMEPADIETVAALTPEDALLFTAGSGLGEGLRESMASLRLQSPEMYEQFVGPFEIMSGLSLEDDVLPLIGSSYGFALGLPGDETVVTAQTLPWILGLVESTDAATLDEHIGVLVGTFEQQCLCDFGVRSSSEGDYLAVRWPEAELSTAPLSDSDAFRELLALLPESPSALFFFNARSASEDVLTDWAGDAAMDPDGDDDEYEVTWDALLGMGVAVSGTETSLTIDFAMPIETPSQQ